MCFSAQASFTASAIILAIGVVAVRRSTTVPQGILASIPIIFAIQQFTEGMLWLSLSHPEMARWNRLATHVFLLFAQVVWPIIVPLSVLLLEKDHNNRKSLRVLLGMGILTGSYLAYCLVFFNVQASISCYHIQYDVYYPIHLKLSGLLYFIPTVIPPIISSIKRLRLLGVIILLSYIFTKIFYENYLVSVWCYFAAIISMVALSVIIQLNEVAQPAVEVPEIQN